MIGFSGMKDHAPPRRPSPPKIAEFWAVAWSTPRGQCVTGPYDSRWGGLFDRPLKGRMAFRLHVRLKPPSSNAQGAE